MTIDPGLAAYVGRAAASPPAWERTLDDLRAGPDDEVPEVWGAPDPVDHVEDRTIDGPGGPLRVRVYRPASSEPLAALLWFHGGGWAVGSLESHDPVCRHLARTTPCCVLAVDYRLAPEHPFPAAVEDCAAAYRWVVAHGPEIGADPARLAVGGDSAGGYLAATTAVTAAEEGLPLAFQLLVYPATDFTAESASRRLFATGFFLSKRFMDGAQEAYFPPGTDLFDPQASVLKRQKFPDGLAPAYVATGGFDPLRDEGEAYAALLAEHGVEVGSTRFPGLIHGFLNVVGCGREALAANTEIARRLREALG
jgi:acetyl esterase